MLKLRRLHLYLGVFFTPLLLFFIVSGWYQTAYPDRRKSIFEASAIMDRLRAVHVEQTFPVATATSYSTDLFRWLVYIMSAAIVLTLLLGLVLAFRTMKKKWLVWLVLALGFIVPALCLWLGVRYDG
jgi:hypothetical protein